LTHHNDVRVAAIDWGTYEQLTFKGAGRGDEVHGYLAASGGSTNFTGKGAACAAHPRGP
jgi:hypothetical protein